MRMYKGRGVLTRANFSMRSWRLLLREFLIFSSLASGVSVNKQDVSHAADHQNVQCAASITCLLDARVVWYGACNGHDMPRHNPTCECCSCRCADSAAIYKDRRLQLAPIAQRHYRHANTSPKQCALPKADQHGTERIQVTFAGRTIVFLICFHRYAKALLQERKSLLFSQVGAFGLSAFKVSEISGKSP